MKTIVIFSWTESDVDVHSNPSFCTGLETFQRWTTPDINWELFPLSGCNISKVRESLVSPYPLFYSDGVASMQARGIPIVGSKFPRKLIVKITRPLCC